MLDSLFKKIKRALPEKIRAKFSKDDLDDEEYDEDEDDLGEETGEFKVNNKGSEEEDDEEYDDDDEEDDDEAQKKKRKQKLIRIALVLVVGYFAMELYLMESNSPEEVAEEAPAPVRPNAVTEAQDETPSRPRGQVEAPQEEVPAQPERSIVNRPTEPVVETEPEPEPELEITERQEETDDISTDTEPAQPSIAVNPTPEPAMERVEEQVPVREPEVVAEVPQAAEEEQEEEIIPEAPAIRERPAEVGLREESSGAEFDQFTEVPKNDQTNPSILGAITERIESKLEQVDPPVYVNTGRGLVYNCTGRHWACVERESYLQCRDHMLWSKQEEQSPSCVVKDVYATVEDCRVVQIHYINTTEPTDFCE
jgi:hypothetical protein